MKSDIGSINTVIKLVPYFKYKIHGYTDSMLY